MLLRTWRGDEVIGDVAGQTDCPGVGMIRYWIF